MTTFPTRRTGLKGRKGSNQFTVCTYSIPKGSLDWWIGHLNSHGIAPGEAATRFRQRYVGFQPPDCRLAFDVLTAVPDPHARYSYPLCHIEHSTQGYSIKHT